MERGQRCLIRMLIYHPRWRHDGRHLHGSNKQASAIVFRNNGVNEFIPFSAKSLQRLNIVDEGKQKPLIDAIKSGQLVLATLDKPAKDADGKALNFNARCFCSAGKGEGFEDLEL